LKENVGENEAKNIRIIYGGKNYLCQEALLIKMLKNLFNNKILMGF
jgi:hypothetical protein